MGSMGAVFAIFAGVTFWYHVLSGCSLDEDITRAHFVVMFVGVNLTFFPQPFLGLAGIPRRYSDYPDSMALGNLISSFGSTIRFVGVVLFISMMVESLSRRRSLVFSSAPSRRLEWLNANDNLPMAHHNSEECLFISHR